ncbi:hypothetical protein O181_007404 [Austropuccinia psidii MF-1]|uniref:Uncharacterized protein n=1 Tax=Austropuccinia psidii MF-1 TaxID=1389203 RepID=A0A9Q3BLW3_9BASI|nr:hypothetical protein [Austropuccinia psidii MF-1]
MENFNKELKMKSDEEEYEYFQQPPMKKLKNSHGCANLKEEFMNKEIIEDHERQKEEISPIEKEHMKSIKEYGLDPESPWRIDKDKEMDFYKGIFFKFYDEMSYWKIPTCEEEPDYLILPYIEFKSIYY